LSTEEQRFLGVPVSLININDALL